MRINPAAASLNCPENRLWVEWNSLHFPEHHAGTPKNVPMHLPLKDVQLYATCKISYFTETLLRLKCKTRGALGWRHRCNVLGAAVWTFPHRCVRWTCLVTCDVFRASAAATGSTTAVVGSANCVCCCWALITGVSSSLISSFSPSLCSLSLSPTSPRRVSGFSSPEEDA